jgi:hypothetical protein
MALTKETVVDKIEVLESNAIQVRSAIRVLEDGEVLSSSYHRHVLQRIGLLAVSSLIGLALLGWLSGQSSFYAGLGVQPNLQAPNDALALLLFMLALPPFTFFLSPLMARGSRRQEVPSDDYSCDQANGSDQRMIRRYGSEIRSMFKNMKWSSHIRFNDWGPYDYHRDFNLTFPVQLMADVSTTLVKPDWFDLPSTRIGLRGTWRSLDQYSPRYAPVLSRDAAGNFVPNPNAIGFDKGQEWEVRTYVQISL